MVSAADVRELALVPVRGTVYVVKLPFVLVWMAVAYILTLLYAILAKIVSELCEESCQEDPSDLELDKELSEGHAALAEDYPRVLLEETGSPPESEEEAEILTRSGDEGGEDVYKLIKDLVQFSRSRTYLPNSHRRMEVPHLDLETLRERARNKEQLTALISDLEQYIRTMDSSTAEGAGRSGGGDLLVTPDPTDRYTDASEGDLEALSGSESAEDRLHTEEEEEEEEFDDAHSSVGMVRGLSPVAEVSPEAASMGSTESLNKNCGTLESELDTAMSQLSTLTDELTEVEVSIVESRQTKRTETVTITSNSRENSSETSFEDAPADFSSIPKTSPTLGLEAGHSRRALATARKARPPSLSKGTPKQAPADGVGDSQVSRDPEFDEGSSDEGESAMPSSHSLSDQLQLLTPTSLRQRGHGQRDEEAQDPAALYSTVNKRAKVSRSEGDDCVGKTESKPRTSSLPEEPTQKSLFIHDLTPPWKQIRSHNSNSGSSGGSPSTTPSHNSATSFQMPSAAATAAAASAQPTFTQSPSPLSIPPRRSVTPPQQQLPCPSQLPSATSDCSSSAELYDRLPRALPAPPIPSRAGEEGLYDIIPGHRLAKPKYLHERVAAASEKKKKDPPRTTPPVSWTPQLPPRNAGSKMKRTCSAEAMGTLEKEQVPRRSGSERRASSSSVREHRERSSSQATPKRSSSSERDREHRRSRHDRPSSSSEHRHHHHHHHRHRSGSDERSSSDRRRKSSSEKHHSPDKKSSPPAEGGGFFWRLLSGPVSSKSKSSSSSSKDSVGKKEKEGREEKSKKEREGREGRSRETSKKKEKDGERRHSSSSKSSKERRSSDPAKTRSSSKKKQVEEEMPRNSSSSSLRSGVSMHSTDSSGRESLI